MKKGKEQKENNLALLLLQQLSRSFAIDNNDSMSNYSQKRSVDPCMGIAVNQIIPMETDAVETNHGGTSCLEPSTDNIASLTKYFIVVTCAALSLSLLISLTSSSLARHCSLRR